MQETAIRYVHTWAPKQESLDYRGMLRYGPEPPLPGDWEADIPFQSPTAEIRFGRQSLDPAGGAASGGWVVGANSCLTEIGHVSLVLPLRR